MDIQELRPAFKGRLISPTDSDYDKARTVFYAGIENTPALIVRAADAEDVAKAIKLASKNGLELAVRSGGHSFAGYSATKGGIVIDMRDMKNLEIDVADKTVWAETGLTAMELTQAVDKHDLVIGFGDTGSVGIGGITLGGGVGFLVRKFGLAIDNLLAAEIVTADGEILQTDKDNHLDLFWAIRGGGGNFGVVTRFKYQLHELGEVLGGIMVLPATAEIIAQVTEIAASAPEELSMIINVMPTFPMPGVPEEYVGKLSIMAMIMYAGDPAEGEKVIAPIRALATPIADMVKPMRYKDIFFPEDEEYHPTAVSQTMHINNIDLVVAQAILAQLEASDSEMRAVQLRVLGGAMARVAPEATAYAHRHNPIMVNIAAFYETEAERKARQIWVTETAAKLDQGDKSVYVGFLGPNDASRAKDAYPEATRQRLLEIKKRYDPTNLFSRNFNIV
jgi:FAD/FMN-containing dehydrogenase